MQHPELDVHMEGIKPNKERGLSSWVERCAWQLFIKIEMTARLTSIREVAALF